MRKIPIIPILALLAVAALALTVNVQGQQQGYSQDQGWSQRQAPPPGYTPEQASQYPPNVLPAGASLLVRLTDTLDASRMSPGKHFEAKVAEPIINARGDVLIPMGKKVKGHVSSIDRGLHGRMLLSFEQIETNHGWVPLIATVTGVPTEKGVKPETGPEGEIAKSGTNPRRTVETAVVGAAIGAAAGGAMGGGRGAGIGAAAGAGLGAASGILTDRNLRLEKNTILELRTDRDMVVPGR